MTLATHLGTLADAYQVSGFPLDAWVRYAELVTEVNEQTNLVGNTAPAELTEVLFADALQLMKSGWLQGPLRVVDVGAGAGAPLLPLALALPDLQVTLVEPRRKRIAFLQRAIGALGLEARVGVLEKSINTKRPVLANSPYDVAMSRATWPVQEWLPIGAALAPRVIAFAVSEPTLPPDTSLKIVDRVVYSLGTHGSQRMLVLFSA